jgi:phosphoribosylpyrophosphate synthetase
MLSRQAKRARYLQAVVITVVAKLAIATIHKGIATIGVHHSKIEAGFNFRMGYLTSQHQQAEGESLH